LAQVVPSSAPCDIATGIYLLAAISHLFGGNSYPLLAKRMVWLTIVSIPGVFLFIGLEIENPWRMALEVVLHPNVTSDIWWMGTLCGRAFFCRWLDSLGRAEWNCFPVFWSAVQDMS
jgi:hypothetical protein